MRELAAVAPKVRRVFEFIIDETDFKFYADISRERPPRSKADVVFHY